MQESLKYAKYHRIWILRIIGVSIVLSFGISGCTLKPETHLPEHQRRVIHAIKFMEQQKKKDIVLADLIHFPKFQPIDQISKTDPQFLEKCQERFNEESLGDPAGLASLHPQLHLLALQDEMTGEIKIYRSHEGESIELGLLYAGVDDMKARFRHHGLSEGATLQEAIDRGMFDVGAVFMVVPEKKQKSYQY